MNLGWTEKITNEKAFRDRGSGFVVKQQCVQFDKKFMKDSESEEQLAKP